MVMSATATDRQSIGNLDLHVDLHEAQAREAIGTFGAYTVHVASGPKNVWLVVASAERNIAALRVGLNIHDIRHLQVSVGTDDITRIEFATPLGAMRAQIRLGTSTLRCTTSFLPSRETALATPPRDLLMLGQAGHVYTAQRGLRSGIVYAGGDDPEPHALLYFQQFTTLNDYFVATKTTPADTVGGEWPELGFRLPMTADAVLPAGGEVVISDAVIGIADTLPASEDEIAAHFLDLLAETYLVLDRPAPAYHSWPARAVEALRDLSLSPLCTYERQGHKYLTPYVGDSTKPPESMVQLTVRSNLAEYDGYRGKRSALQAGLRAGIGAFYNPEIESVVRWLPGETFDEAQADDNMSHEAMDSWYLHHSLFNVFRLASEGDAEAKRMFEASLPFLIRVAHRFDYQWPIFFNLKTLDIIRAESQPGRGGETDVAGLYALVMIHAHELFGTSGYLDEAKQAIERLRGRGFHLAYQLNTTGFAAEAALRLFLLTNDRQYLGIAEICLANIFDNMLLWQCSYDHAAHYTTFFGLFPLRDAPYLAPYEELEAHAKFHEFLRLAGDAARPSLKLLIAEYQKYSLDRCWYYYAATLPVTGLAEQVRNGHLVRDLSIPLEDLQDGREASGQVGQEVYGAGLPFVLTARHYVHIARHDLTAYASYPMYDFAESAAGLLTWRAGGDPRCAGELRIIPATADTSRYIVAAWSRAGSVRTPVPGTLTEDGHALFPIRGSARIEVSCKPFAGGVPPEGQVLIGSAFATVSK
jgi:hypothetical protein